MSALPITNRKNAYNCSGRIYQTKAVGFSTRVALGDITCARFPGCDRLVFIRKGLAETGFVEGQNVAIDPRYAQTIERLRESAADLARSGWPPRRLLRKAATRTIPIVFESGGDPIRSGIVASLNKPDGNATGFSYAVARKCLVACLVGESSQQPT